METSLKRDVERLIGDNEKIGQGLRTLEQDHAAWIRDREWDDLANLLKGVKGLESDVSVLMGDCVSLDRAGQDGRLWGDFNRAYNGLDTLFEDLKTVRKEIALSYASRAELDQLEIDWARFRKNVEQIRKDLDQA